MIHPDYIDLKPVRLKAILGLREQYRQEMNCQIVHDSYHARGFTQSYILRFREEVAGYGSVDTREAEATIKEFYLLPTHRLAASMFFRVLLAATGAHWIEAQTNDRLLSQMLAEHAGGLKSHTILLSHEFTTKHPAPLGVTLRPVTRRDRRQMFPHTTEPIGDWGLECDHQIVATGGLFFHYNPPYGDIYMEVAASSRRRGYGSYLVQELVRLCREKGYIPAARCDVDNVGSRLALERAGLRPCGQIVKGFVAV